jgi:hypothetical protein
MLIPLLSVISLLPVPQQQPVPQPQPQLCLRAAIANPFDTTCPQSHPAHSQKSILPGKKIHHFRPLVHNQLFLHFSSPIKNCLQKYFLLIMVCVSVGGFQSAGTVSGLSSAW